VNLYKKIVSYFLIVLIGMFVAGCAGAVMDVTNGVVEMTHSVSGDDKTLNKEKIFLKVDKESHFGAVRSLVVTNNKKYFITGGDDADIRVWDAKSYKMVKKISGYIGEDGSTGAINTMAISPNDKYLAVGGFFAKSINMKLSMTNIFFSDDLKLLGLIRIYNLETGKLVTSLRGHINSITDLKFSSDGKILISSGADLRTRIWQVNDNFKLMTDFRGHDKIISESAIRTVAPNEYEIITASYDKSIQLRHFFLNNNKITLVKTYRQTNSFMGVAISKNFIIASSWKQGIILFDKQLNFIRKIYSKEKSNPFKVKITSDEKYLAMAEGHNVRVYDLKDNDKEIVTYKGHLENILALGLLDNNTIISSSLNVNVIKIKKDTLSKKFPKLNSDYIIRNIGVNDSKLGYGFKEELDKKGYYKKPFKRNMNGKLEYYLDLKKQKISSVINGKEFKRLSEKKDAYNAKVSISRTKVHVYNGNSLVGTILANTETARGKVRAYWFYKNYILCAIDTGVFVYKRDDLSSYVVKFLGHSQKIHSMTVDKDRLYTGSADGTIKIWDLTKIGQKNIIKPLVTIFAHDNDWVMYNEKGYFNASNNGSKYIGFQITNGPYDKATFIGIDKLYDVFFRPDLVQLSLEGKDISQFTNGMTYQEALENPPPEINIKEKDLKTTKKNVTINFDVKQVEGGGLGLIRVYQEGKLVKTIGKGNIKRVSENAIEKLNEDKLNKESKLKQKQYLASLEGSITKSINGTLDTSELVKTIQTTTTNNKEGNYSITLPLKAGKNSISIEAFNKTNTVLSVRESVTVDAKIKKRTPKIYAIVFGVNKFEQGNVSELKYSENDAKAIGKVIKNATKYKTYVTYLTGKKATKEELLKAIDKIQKKAHLEDKIVFYISTHGKAVRGNLYLVPQNNKRVKNWLNFEEVFNKIQSIPALDQIFIIDACESGKASDIMSSVYDAKASVLAKQSGVHVLMATTKGTFAFENPDPSVKHGVFTNNILNILKSKKTDNNSDGWISIKELSNKLKEPEYSVEHQFPIIRNVGQDTNIKRVK